MDQCVATNLYGEELFRTSKGRWFLIKPIGVEVFSPARARDWLEDAQLTEVINLYFGEAA